jgi:two-component system LytT family response regulator
MTELKCIAVDDEPLALRLIMENIKRIPFLNCIEGFNSAVKAQEYLKDNSADLIFLDIQMPGLSGMEFAKTVKDTMIIFTTAFDNYAVEGFEVAAIDYILKPVMFDRFEKACVKAKEIYELKSQSPKEELTIMVRADHKSIKLLLKDIIYIEGLKDYVKVFVEGENKPLLTRTNLKGFNTQLPESMFRRIHKSYVVNINKINGIGANSLMAGKTELPIGDVYKGEIRLLLNGGN